MDFISGLVLVLLTLVGYSSGCSLAGKGRKVAPGLIDLAVVIILWIGALSTRELLGKWMSILIWLIAGGIVGALLMLTRRNTFAKPRPWELKSKPAEGSLMRRIWIGWKSYAQGMGDYQSRILLILFYFIIVTPFAILVRLFSDPLRIRSTQNQSYWLPRPQASTDVEEARRQF